MLSDLQPDQDHTSRTTGRGQPHQIETTGKEVLASIPATSSDPTFPPEKIQTKTRPSKLIQSWITFTSDKYSSLKTSRSWKY